MVEWKDAAKGRLAALEREAAERKGREVAAMQLAAATEMRERILGAVDDVAFIMAFLKAIAPDLRAGRKLSAGTVNKLIEIGAGEKLGISHLLSLDAVLDREERKQPPPPSLE